MGNHGRKISRQAVELDPKKIKKQRQKYKYMMIITWSEEDRGYGVEIPELPGCFSFGDTIIKATQNATKAIELWLKTAKEDGEEVPEPMVTKKYSGKFNLRLEPELHRNLSLQAVKKNKSLNTLVSEILGEAL